MKYTVDNIRKLFQKFFVTHSHHYIDPVSIVPVNDDSLLWINSGVATLKPYFTGKKMAPSSRLINTQPSLRTVDLPMIAETNRHLTSFVMLGHFSLGDYFKKEAIKYAWEFITSADYLNLDPAKIFITVYKKDHVAQKILKNDLKINPQHIILNDKNLNFWDMGSGPCGPNVEFFFDLGEKHDPQKLGTKILEHDYDSNRYLEIWNCVFSEFNHLPNDVFQKLPQQNIDTGAGLERIAMVMQQKENVYEIDIFQPFYKQFCAEFKLKFENLTIVQKKALYCLADHMRTVALAISYGAKPDSHGRNYVIRRILRKCFIIIKNLNVGEIELAKYLKASFYSWNFLELNLTNNSLERFQKIISDEQNQFNNILSAGVEKINKYLTKHKTIDTAAAFNFFETHGIPLDILEDTFADKINISTEKYNSLLQKHKIISHGKDIAPAMDLQADLVNKLEKKSVFMGYNYTNLEAKALYLLDEKNNLITDNNSCQIKYLICDQTPFYPEGGGQIYDTGCIANKAFSADVVNVQKIFNDNIVHELENISGTIKQNDTLALKINVLRRQNVANLHTATHLVNAAVNKILTGEKYKLKQKGSAIFPDYMRFDFYYDKPISIEKITQISNEVNHNIMTGTMVKIFKTSLHEAKELGACMLDEDKYLKQVRIIKYGDFSMELCGGTHVNNLSEIEQIFITNFASKGKNIFRLNVICGKQNIANYIADQKTNLLAKLDQKGVSLININHQLLKDYKMLQDTLIKDEKDLYNFNQDIASQFKKIEKLIQQETQQKQSQALQTLVKSLNPFFETTKTMFFCVSNINNKLSRNVIDQLSNIYSNKNKYIVLFSHLNDSKYLSFVIKNKTSNLKLPCVQVLSLINDIIQGKGGGHDNFAQGVFSCVENFFDLQIFQEKFKNFI